MYAQQSVSCFSLSFSPSPRKQSLWFFVFCHQHLMDSPKGWWSKGVLPFWSPQEPTRKNPKQALNSPPARSVAKNPEGFHDLHRRSLPEANERSKSLLLVVLLVKEGGSHFLGLREPTCLEFPCFKAHLCLIFLTELLIQAACYEVCPKS